MKCKSSLEQNISHCFAVLISTEMANQHVLYPMLLQLMQIQGPVFQMLLVQKTCAFMKSSAFMSSAHNLHT